MAGRGVANVMGERWPAEFDRARYDWARYVTRRRILAYWYQVSEVLALAPRRLLEIGVGPGVVTSYLRHVGIDVTTVDINAALAPDRVCSVLELKREFDENEFDVVLCARVLHHLPFQQLGCAMSQVAWVSRRYCVLALAAEEAKVTLGIRITGWDGWTVGVSVPLWMKRVIQGARGETRLLRHSSLWKVGTSRMTSVREIRRAMEERFTVAKQYLVPADGTHLMMILEKRKDDRDEPSG